MSKAASREFKSKEGVRNEGWCQQSDDEDQKEIDESWWDNAPVPALASIGTWR